jgi:hypothetical protein
MQTALSRKHPRIRALVVAALMTALAASTLGGADASSHREAPLITRDPCADNTDVYAFVSPDRKDYVTLIANFQGFQEAGGGPNWYQFCNDVKYEIKVDSNADAKPDVTYEFRFSSKTVDGNTYQYNTGPINNITDKTWNRPQSYSVYKVANGKRTTIASNRLTAPANIGPRSTPDYDNLARQAVFNLPGGGKVFAGPRDEGFYADIASIFNLGGLRPFDNLHAIPQPQADGVDTFAGYNVQSIALQVPKTDLVKQDPVIGVWSTSSRRKVTALSPSGGKPSSFGQWTQVSRLGNGLVNEVVVPLKAKDAFNALPPAKDADVFPTLSAPPLSTQGPIPLVTDPILAEQIKALYGIQVPNAPRNDLVSVFLTGVPGLNKPRGNVRPAEVLRLNTSIAPTPFAQQDPLGVLAGQNDGYPNGRRVGDDVIDISLRAVAGVLVDGFNKAPNNALSDGVQSNDKPYLNQFPYLATPHQGYELNNPARVPSS